MAQQDQLASQEDQQYDENGTDAAALANDDQIYQQEEEPTYDVDGQQDYGAEQQDYDTGYQG